MGALRWTNMSTEAPSCDEEWHVESAAGDRTEQVVLLNPCATGTLLLRVMRSPQSIVSEAAWDTPQVGEHGHARFGHKALKLNHSTMPNTRIAINEQSVDVVAATSIAANEALSFDYNTTEWKMAEPFTDWVSGANVQGFYFASPADQARLLLGGLVAPHIRKLAEHNYWLNR